MRDHDMYLPCTHRARMTRLAAMHDFYTLFFRFSTPQLERYLDVFEAVHNYHFQNDPTFVRAVACILFDHSTIHLGREKNALLAGNFNVYDKILGPKYEFVNGLVINFMTCVSTALSPTILIETLLWLPAGSYETVYVLSSLLSVKTARCKRERSTYLRYVIFESSPSVALNLTCLLSLYRSVVWWFLKAQLVGRTRSCRMPRARQ